MRKLLLIGTMGALSGAARQRLRRKQLAAGPISVAKEGEGKAANAACEEEPVAGGSLVYARQLETVTLNPREIKNGNGDIFADEMLYNGTRPQRPERGRQSRARPGRKLGHLQGRPDLHVPPAKGLKYSDGSPLTAEDIAWNLEQFAQPGRSTSSLRGDRRRHGKRQGDGRRRPWW